MSYLANQEGRMITFTPELRDELRREYHYARERGDTEFEFLGGLMLTDYAKYMLEYLDMQFSPTPGQRH